MRTLLSAITLSTLAVSGCAFPARDNPNDPVNRPDATLTISGPTGAVGTRATVFRLDASASGPTDEALAFTWDVDGDGVFEERPDAIECGGRPGACLDTTIPLTLETLPGGIGTAQRPVRVRVTAPQGSDVAEVSAFVSNAAPALTFPEHLFVPELTGSSVVIDACPAGSCTDPDGELIDWSWEPLRADGVTLSGTSQSGLTFVAPRDERTLLFRLTASDEGALASASQRVHVHVTSAVWISSLLPTRVYRLYPDFRKVLTRPQSYAPDTAYSTAYGGMASDENAVWAGVTRVDPGSGFIDTAYVSKLEPGPDGDLVETDRWDLDPNSSAAPAVAVSGGVACAAQWSFDPLFHRFLRLPAGAAPIETSTGGVAPRFVHAAPGGECWAVAATDPSEPSSTQGSKVYRIATNGQVAYQSPGAFLLDDVEASATSADGTLWVAGMDGACVGGSRLLRFSPSGGDPVSSCLDGLEVDALARAPSGLFAHDRASGGFSVVGTNGALQFQTDAPTTLLAEQEVLAAFLPPPAEPRILVDELAGDVWVVDAEGTLVRMRLAGNDIGPSATSVLATPFFNGIPRFQAVTLIAQLGRLAASVERLSQESGIAWIPSHLQRVQQVFVSGPAIAVAADPPRGEAWIADGTQGSTAVRRVDLLGGTRATAEDPLQGIATDIAAAQDGGAVASWGVGFDGGLVALDPDGATIGSWTTTTPIVSVDRDESGLVCALGIDGSLEGSIYRTTDPSLSTTPTAVLSPGALEWAIPRGIRAVSPWCWAIMEGDAGSGYDGELVRYDGSAPDRVPLVQPLSLAVDPLSGDAWVAATGTDGATTVVSRVDSADLSIELRFGDPLLNQINLIDVQRRCGNSSCTNPGVLTLWVARGNSVERTDEFGNVLDAFNLPEASQLYDLDVLP